MEYESYAADGWIALKTCASKLWRSVAELAEIHRIIRSALEHKSHLRDRLAESLQNEP